MRIGERLFEQSGQALPVAVIFAALIFGAAALTIDVGKVYSLRNQTTTATTAAALAAAQVLTQELNQEISANPTKAPSLSNLNLSSAQQAADAVYQSNIQTALPNSGLGNNPTVDIQPVTSTFLQASAQYSQWSPYLGMVVVQVKANGTTPMNFGAALGIPDARVHAASSALVGLQNAVAKNALLPLAIPSNAGNSSLPLPTPYNTWEQNIQPGQSFFLYRGDAGKKMSSLPEGFPSNAIDIPFSNLFGAGNDGILNYAAVTGSYVAIGSQVDAMSSQGSTSGTESTPGSAEWNTLSHLTVGETVILPVGDSMTSGKGSINVVGFITARVVATTELEGTQAGFVITVKDLEADVPETQLEGVGSANSSYAPTFAYQLIP